MPPDPLEPTWLREGRASMKAMKCGKASKAAKGKKAMKGLKATKAEKATTKGKSTKATQAKRKEATQADREEAMDAWRKGRVKTEVADHDDEGTIMVADLADGAGGLTCIYCSEPVGACEELFHKTCAGEAESKKRAEDAVRALKVAVAVADAAMVAWSVFRSKPEL